MGKMSIDESDFLARNLLPIEEERDVNGIKKMVPIEYLAEITSASEGTGRSSGIGFLKLILAVDNPNGSGRVYITDILSYHPNAIFRLAGLINILGLSRRSLDTDDFLNQFVFINIRHEVFRSEVAGTDVIDNRVAKYVRRATQEEIASGRSF